MDKLIISLAFMAIIGVVIAFPADHREDTVLPFSLSPGNVNLETYYLDKYPGPPPAKQSPPENNMFVEGDEPGKMTLRSRREANPQHHHHGGYHHGGQGHYNPPVYHHHQPQGHHDDSHRHHSTHGHHHHH